MRSTRSGWSTVMLVACVGLLAGTVGVPRARACGDGVDEHATRAWLGVLLDDADGGAHVVAVIDDGPADEAGVPRGAVITGIDGEPVEGAAALRRAIRSRRPGETVTLGLREESGAERTVEVTLGKRTHWPARAGVFAWKGIPEGLAEALPEVLAEAERHVTVRREARAFLGVKPLSPSPGVRRALGGPDDAGVLVNEVVEGSPAAAAGLAAGDLIVAVDGAPVTSARDLSRVLGKHVPGDVVRLEIVRGARQRTIEVTLGEAESRVFVFGSGPGGELEFVVPDFDVPDSGELHEKLEELRERLEKLRGNRRLHREPSVPAGEVVSARRVDAVTPAAGHVAGPA